MATAHTQVCYFDLCSALFLSRLACYSVSRFDILLSLLFIRPFFFYTVDSKLCSCVYVEFMLVLSVKASSYRHYSIISRISFFFNNNNNSLCIFLISPTVTIKAQNNEMFKGFMVRGFVDGKPNGSFLNAPTGLTCDNIPVSNCAVWDFSNPLWNCCCYSCCTHY